MWRIFLGCTCICVFRDDVLAQNCSPTPSNYVHLAFVYAFCVCLYIIASHLQCSQLGHSLCSWTSDYKWGIGEYVVVLFLMICLVSVPGNRLHFLCSTSHRMCWKLKKSFPISTLWRRRSATTLSGCPALPKSAQPMHLRGPSLSSQTRWEDLRGFADFTPPFSLSCTWARSGGLGCAHLFGIFESTVYVTVDFILLTYLNEL